MKPDTAELALPDAAAVIPAWPAPVGARARAAPPIAHGVALRDTWRALWTSRSLVWIAGSGSVLAFGFGPTRKVLQHAELTRGLGAVGNVLAAPAARWDAAWYLLIARAGYAPSLGSATTARSAFFPLYPLAVRALAELFVPAVLGGVLVSLAAMGAALYGLHRLTELEVRSGFLGAAARPFGALAAARPGEVARLAVLAVAFFPVAFFLSADYGESLYLALSIGVFWCARNGRFAWTGALGALAAATRPLGVLLLAPAAILYLYGPREDRPPAPRGAGRLAWARPRYSVSRDIAWLVLIPAGLLAFMAYLALAGGDPTAPFAAQGLWGRQLAGPVLGLWQGAVAAFEGLRQVLSMQAHHAYFAQGTGNPLVGASHNVPLFVLAVAALAATVGVLRALPLAYGAYVLLALGLALSYPVSSEPLMSLPRFLLELFPLAMWLGVYLHGRPRLGVAAFTASAVLLAFLTGAFATWHWVS
jgi:hypothetical protein